MESEKKKWYEGGPINIRGLDMKSSNAVEPEPSSCAKVVNFDASLVQTLKTQQKTDLSKCTEFPPSEATARSFRNEFTVGSGSSGNKATTYGITAKVPAQDQDKETRDEGRRFYTIGLCDINNHAEDLNLIIATREGNYAICRTAPFVSGIQNEITRLTNENAAMKNKYDELIAKFGECVPTETVPFTSPNTRSNKVYQSRSTRSGNTTTGVPSRSKIYVDKPKHVCDLCGKEFGFTSSKTIHIQSVHKGKRWLCGFCGKECMYPSSKYHHEKKCRANPAVLAGVVKSGISRREICQAE